MEMKEEWLMPGAVVPVDVKTIAALVAEIKRLIGVIGGMALNMQPASKPWVGLTDEDIQQVRENCGITHHAIKTIEAKLKEKNT